jgi:acyl carrier protein
LPSAGAGPENGADSGAMFAETWMSGRDEELIDIISEEALIDRAKLDRAAKLEDIGLDSVDLVSVVFAIEEKYGIEIAEDAFDRSDTLGAVLTKIDGLIDAKPA